MDVRCHVNLGALLISYYIPSSVTAPLDLASLCLGQDHLPQCSMYGIASNIYPQNDPNVGKYSIQRDAGKKTDYVVAIAPNSYIIWALCGLHSE